ncbi:hypothetical protein R5R35_006480 [Gryllus longicercus]|uniref:Peroxisomal membrane protein PMP34 n=1 Tax=Gryllus longicercus TaxID=2509291 RepID=A0AAN9VTL5_9ORTH|nr:Mitochondrial carrier protein Rim2 [Gryllus bimaculatus]
MGTDKLFSYQTLVHAVSGAAGSVVAMSTFYPLDTVRSRLQLDEHRKNGNTFVVLKELVAEEGFGTLYRGMVPVLQSLCASNFVYFYAFHGLKATRGQKATQGAGTDLLLASVAGIINVLTTNPLWVVNTRLKMKGLSGQQTQQYSGLWEGLLKVAKVEGIGKLWSGMTPSLLLVSNPAIQFMVYESLKRRLHSVYKPENISGLVYFALGATAKALATVLTYPLQLVQAKLRHGHSYKDLRPDAGLIDMTMYILKKYGLAGLFKGMEAKILQTVFTAALMFAAYEKIAGFIMSVLLVHHKGAIKMKH